MKLRFQPYIERLKQTPYETWASVLFRTTPGLCGVLDQQTYQGGT
jgi:hypothetical protein